MRLSSRQRAIGLFVMGLFCAAVSGIALAAGTAEGLGTVAKNIQSGYGDLAKVITATAYIAGISFVLVSLFKFKAAKDNPTQEHIGKPIAYLFIGVAMIFVPSLMNTGGQTLFGSSATSAGVSGISNLNN
ncbi:MAG: type IV secretion protein IcmD [Gammaproteobacteria bacterium]|nr:type IV secretion protein IcmD [Gammaproteobacteria bacterium]